MTASGQAPPVLVRVIRGGAVESVHRGHVVLAAADGTVLGALGNPWVAIYARSAVKPFQAVAVLDLLTATGVGLDVDGIAIACASHTGSAEQQIEAARLLALAALDESALCCPAVLPTDLATLLDQREPAPLAHQCSGKHAAFLLAQTAAGAAPRDYLDPGSVVQRAVHEQLAAVSDSSPRGPAVDGCGAPAWLVPLAGLATAAARLAAPNDQGDRTAVLLQLVRAAMGARPDLVGGPSRADTVLMVADSRVVAKRGAEAVFAGGLATAAGPGRGLGVAVKIADGGERAAAPVAATVLRDLGAAIPPQVVEPPVLGGGRPHGRLAVDQAVGGLAGG